MDIGLIFRQIVQRNGGLTRCPNCRKIYDPLESVCDWGVEVGSDDGYVTSFDICGKCIYHPTTIDLNKVKSEHRHRGTSHNEIEQGIDQLRLLKEGKLKPSEVINGL